nr:uncharacterized protein LOC109417400 [Aedes albopictus]
MGRPNKKRSAARQREVGKKLKRELTDPLAWTFEDPWRTIEEIPGPTAIGSSMQDIRQPETPICVEEDLPPFPLEHSPLPVLPELPEFDGRWGSAGTSPIDIKDVRQPEAPICVEEDLPPVPLEHSPLPDLPELPEFDGRWGSDGASPIRKEEQQASLVSRYVPYTPSEDYLPYSMDTTSGNSANSQKATSSFLVDTMPLSQAPITSEIAQAAGSSTCMLSLTDDQCVGANKPTDRTIKLARSSTLKFEISGLPPGKMCNTDQDCYCAACMKWDTVTSSENVNPNFKRIQVEESSEAAAMKKIYGTLRGIKPTCRFKIKLKRTIRPGIKGLRNASKRISVKRYLL